MSKHRIAALAAGLLTLLTPLAQAASFSSLVIFGDSLSDSGNNAVAMAGMSPWPITSNASYSQVPYASGTYSNGQVWAQYLASQLGLSATPSMAGGSNYAFGGAETSNPGAYPGGFPYPLSQQLAQYLGQTGNTADANALYVVSGGGNNVRAVLESLTPSSDLSALGQALANAYASDIGSMVDQLQAAGAQHIVVWNTPDFGLTPYAQSYGSLLAGIASSWSAAMNNALSTRLAGEGVLIFDTYSLLNGLVSNAASYGFTNVTDACGAEANALDCSTALFYDGIHPTTAAHELIAQAFYASVSSVPEPASVALWLIGGGLLWVRRRPMRHAATNSLAPAA